MSSVFRRLLVLAAVIWCAGLFLAVYAATHQGASSPWYGFTLSVYGLGSFICHQRPERSFHLWAGQLPVCARCTGIYVGAAVAAPGFPALQPGRVRTALVAAAAPNVMTLGYEWLTGVAPSNWIRAVAGFPLGAVVMLVLLAQLRGKRL